MYRPLHKVQYQGKWVHNVTKMGADMPGLPNTWELDLQKAQGG